MRFSLKATFLSFLSLVSADQFLETNSLLSCQNNNGFSASLFHVRYHPNNSTLDFNIVGTSTIAANITAEISVTAYGYDITTINFDPCANSASIISGLCPLASGPLTINSNVEIPKSVVGVVPGIAYTIPDLDGVVQIKIHSKNTGAQVACVKAFLSNGKTVYQKGVGWSTAVIAGLALLVSALVSGLGHSNTAAHVAANALSLFGFMQTQAFFGMTAVHLPPIVASWTQNFQWSMGIIHISFIQNIAYWYQRATGGTAATLLSNLADTSVNVQKRSLEVVAKIVPRSVQYMADRGYTTYAAPLLKRATVAATTSPTVRGIERVGYRASIESTNIFMTGWIFFVIFIMFVILGVLAFKLILELLARGGRMKSDKFLEFRNGWSIVLKGILFRLVSLKLCFYKSHC